MHDALGNQLATHSQGLVCKVVLEQQPCVAPHMAFRSWLVSPSTANDAGYLGSNVELCTALRALDSSMGVPSGRANTFTCG